jgi:signal transduction histidine kinase
MDMDKAFIEDVVNRAAVLVTAKGKEAFVELRDKKGPYVFMDVYVFVDDPNGVELVNPAQPSIEGKNVMDMKDANGVLLAKEYIDAAMKKGNAWVQYYWYKPGSNVPTLKHSFVKKVTHGEETYILGAGFYEHGE